MTIKQMARILVDKGHSPQWAQQQAELDYKTYNSSYEGFLTPDLFTYDCSICRERLTPIQWKYHYHACE